MERTADRTKNNHHPDKQPSSQARSRGFWNNIRLQTRLTLLVAIIAIPTLILGRIVSINQVGSSLRGLVNEQLQLKNSALETSTRLWLDTYSSLLKQMAAMEDIAGMDPARQQKLLTQTSQAFPSLYLIHVMDRNGMDIARSDGLDLVSYSDRTYFKNALSGVGLSYEVILGRTSNQPALAMSVPIHDSSGATVGVLSGVSELGLISEELVKAQNSQILGQAQAFIVDGNNQVVAHSDPAISAALSDFGAYQPVAALRQGSRGRYEYVDNQGKRWLAYLSVMDNNWGIVTQMDLNTALAPVNRFSQNSWLIMLLAAALLVSLSAFSIRRSLRPIRSLKDTAVAIAGGDLTRTATVERNDEIGELAIAFNSMTHQLRGSIETLEKGVAERSRVVELTAEVSRRLSMILDLGQLVREVVDQLQKAFNYYHAHIYLFDESHENLVMVGGTGEAGRVMLARGHKIPRGRGLVGRAAQLNEPVLVRDTREDPGWLPNALLPETKSEVAVPITLSGEVLGVLDVQQNTQNGLGEADVALIQSIAQQVAIAVQNSRAFTQAQRRADQEAFASEINRKIQRTASVDEALQVAVSELGRALNAKHAAVELSGRSITPEKDA